MLPSASRPAPKARCKSSLSSCAQRLADRRRPALENPRPPALRLEGDHRIAPSRDMSLFLRTLRNSVIGLVVLCLLIFVPAGTLAWWQGWAFIGVFAVATNAIGLWLAVKDPALLERRLNVGPQAET